MKKGINRYKNEESFTKQITDKQINTITQIILTILNFISIEVKLNSNPHPYDH